LLLTLGHDLSECAAPRVISDRLRVIAACGAGAERQCDSQQAGERSHDH
jgi:hypothetical protein